MGSAEEGRRHEQRGLCACKLSPHPTHTRKHVHEHVHIHAHRCTHATHVHSQKFTQTLAYVHNPQACALSTPAPSCTMHTCLATWSDRAPAWLLLLLLLLLCISWHSA